MAAVLGNYAGDITELYFSSAVIESKTETNLEAAVTTANRVGRVTEPGEIGAERTVISFAVAGEDYSSSVVGQADPGTYDFTVAVEWEDTLHNTLATDNGKTSHTFIVKLNQGDANNTLIAFDGRIANATIGGGVGEVGTLSVSIARTGGHTIVHNS